MSCCPPLWGPVCIVDSSRNQPVKIEKEMKLNGRAESAVGEGSPQRCSAPNSRVQKGKNKDSAVLARVSTAVTKYHGKRAD